MAGKTFRQQAIRKKTGVDREKFLFKISSFLFRSLQTVSPGITPVSWQQDLPKTSDSAMFALSISKTRQSRCIFIMDDACADSYANPKIRGHKPYSEGE